MTKDVTKKILDATMETIAREKISGTRMHLIAKEAQLSQSNLHYYFPTKDDLLIAVLNDMQTAFMENRSKVVDLENKTPEENLAGLFTEKKQDILENKKVDYVQFDFWVQGTVNPDVRNSFQKTFDIWRNSIQEVISHDPELSQLDKKEYELLPFMIVSLMMGASMQYLIDEGKFDLDDYFVMAKKMVLNMRNNK